MNIGIRLHDTAPGTLEQRLAFAKTQGFSCAHVALSKVLPDFDMSMAPERLNDALAQRVHGAFDAAGMDCAVLGCYLCLTAPEGEELKRTQEIYRAHLRFSMKIGATVVGTETPPASSLGMSQRDMESEEAFSLFMKCLRPLVRCAEEEGAILAIEPVCEHIISTPQRAQRMLEEIHSDSLRIILDAVNLLRSDMTNRADDVIEDAIERLGDRVSVLHMKDFIDAPGQSRPHSIACGTGRMNYESLLALARQYELPMTLEDTTPDNAEAARLHLERVNDKLF